MIIIVRFFEEIIDEINRYKRDKKLNFQEYQVYDRKSKNFKKKYSQDIKEGDIIKIFNQRVPSDIIILQSK